MNSILVTGTSTGIGRACAERLARAGNRVFAGVRRESDAPRADGGEIVPIVLDVADADSVAAAVETLSTAAGGELAGLVNNAGVYIGGPLELMTSREIRMTYEVNVIGLLELTRHLLPLLRPARGRIVNISSISGLVALPGVSVYAGSKHAVEAVTDALRVELKPQGIHVAAVEPGSIDTAIWKKGEERDAGREGDAELRELYRPIVDMLEKLNRDPRGIPADDVAIEVERALTDPRPANRYVVGKDAKALKLLRLLPDGVRDGLISARLR